MKHLLKTIASLVLLTGFALAQPELTNTEATNITTEAQRNAWRSALEMLGEIKSVSFTAENQTAYVADATLTVTDPTPAEGKGFSVFVNAGTATVGGTAYATAGTIVRRFYEGGAWISRAYTPDNAVAITGGTITGVSSASITGDLTVDTSTLKVDSTNNRVGIGIATPTKELDVVKNYDGDTNIRVANNNNGTSGSATFVADSNSANTLFGATGVNYGGFGIITSSCGYIYTGANGGLNLVADSAPIKFAGYGLDEIAQINGSGMQLASTKTLHFADNSGTWNGSTIAGNQTFSGSVKGTATTDITDPTSIPNVNAVIDMMAEGRVDEEYFVKDYGTSAVGGTGQVYASNAMGSGVYMRTNTTTGSWACWTTRGASGADNSLARVKSGLDTRWINWSEKQIISVTVAETNGWDANSKCFVFLGENAPAVTNAEPTSKGVGFSIEGLSGPSRFVYLWTHDGTTLHKDLIGAVNTRIKLVLRAYLDGAGNCTGKFLFAGNTLSTTVATAPTGSPASGSVAWRAVADNTTGTADIFFRVYKAVHAYPY